MNGEGQPVILRGCNLGNWLLLEMWMLDLRDIPDQVALESILTRRFGAEAARQLLDLYRANYIQPRDFDLIKSFGFNVVRLPFEYRLLQDDAQPLVLKTNAFTWLDRAVQMAGQAGLYVILDLHGAPGRQSTDHTTGQAGVNELWTESSRQQQTAWLWREIARHFRDSASVAGYDLLNEPFGDYHSDHHLAPLVKLMDDIYQSVRSVDTNHLVFISGPQQGIEIYGDPGAHGWKNVVFTEHYYPGIFQSKASLESHARFIGRTLNLRQAYLDRLQVPFLVGEFNVVLERLAAPLLMRRYFDEYGSRGWAATLWAYKGIRQNGGAGGDNWFMVTNRDPPPAIDPRKSSRPEIESYLTWLGSMEYAVQEPLREQLTNLTPETLALGAYPPPLTEPPARDDIPGWTATDIGDSLAGGQRRLDDHGLDIYAGGADIWRARDQFRFIGRPAVSNFEISAQLNALENTSPYAKAGLMIRNGLAPDAAHVFLHLFPDGHLLYAWRDAKGAAMEERKIRITEYPVFLKVDRAGAALRGLYSHDGLQWREAFRATPAWLGPDAYAGLAVLAHDENKSLTTARFREIHFRE